jgi:hypothetical protein
MHDTEQGRIAVDALRRSLGAEGHQYFAAMHYDEDTSRYHIHVGINAVGLNGRCLGRWQDYAKMARAAEWCEREFGLYVDRHAEWRSKLGERDFHWSFPELDGAAERKGAIKGVYRQEGGSIDRRDAVRRTHYSWVELLASDAAPAVQAAMERDGASWGDVHAVLRSYGVRLVCAGSGARIVGPERGQHVKASDIGLDIRAMETRFGALAESLPGDERQGRIEFAKGIIRGSEAWEMMHEELERLGFAIERTNRGARLLDLEEGAHVPFRKTGLSFQSVEQRIGPFVEAPAAAERDAREERRRADGLSERAALLRAQPELVIDVLAETMSVWSAQDVERAVRSSLGAGPSDAVLVGSVADALLTHCVRLDEDAFTVEAVLTEERAVFTAVETLAHRTRSVSVRAADAGLDIQQHGAFAHLTGERDLAVVTGIAGAGKSRLQRDVAAAYTEAGYRVVGVAVAGDAARTLGEEARIATRTVAKLLSDLQRDRDRLDARTVLMIDEAGTLGCAQAKLLFEEARDVGARVLLLGDTSQHESVGRGAVLRGIVEEYGTFDMVTTRRAKAEWMRTVAEHLRDRCVSRALDVLRDHGAVREYDTNEEARRELVRAWSASMEQGRRALLVATSNADVLALNALAREAMGAQLGREQVYDTAFGERTFADGDVLVGRQAAHGGVNGDLYRLVAHREHGCLELLRLRDGVNVRWDVLEHSMIDHGYAVTSYRSQGRTVDDIFALASSNEARRGLYVDVTRATENVTVVYGRDQIEDFGELLYRAQRDGDKQLVRDYQKRTLEQKEQEAERELEQEGEELEIAV